MSGKRPWRTELKKQQRKRRRIAAAIARDQRLEQEEADKLDDPAYQQFLQQRAQNEKEQLRLAEQRHADEEVAWMRCDLLAQREFRSKQAERIAAEAAALAKRKHQAEELAVKEAEQQRRREERERKVAAAAAEFEQMMQCMESFLNNDGPPPAELRRVVESRPGQNVCTIYERTNCCRFGVSCINNHRRPMLANTIVVRHFFIHPLLEENEHKEYANADGGLELSEQDLQEAYDDFYEDVVPEFEGFGCLRNFRAVRNILRHMRGHVFVEYWEERSALKAFIKLQNRYYAGRRLNVEFSNINIWRSAICGLSHTRKCPKGEKCQYLHLFKNPGNQYGTPLEVNRTPNKRSQMATPLLSWNMVTANDVKEKSRNWRWSESPEIEIPVTKFATKKTEKVVSNHDECSKNTSDTQINNTTCLQTQKRTESAVSDSKSKRRHKKHKHERDNARKKHKSKHSRRSDRDEERRAPQIEGKASKNKHKRIARSRRSYSSTGKSDDSGECSRNRNKEDDRSESSLATKKNEISKRKHSTAAGKISQRRHYKYSSSEK